MIKAIFLDFEGVLTKNSLFIHTDVYDLVKDKISLNKLNKRYSKARLLNKSFKEFEKGFPSNWMEKAIKKIKFHSGTKEFLNWAKEKHRLYVASNNIPILCEKEMDYLSVRKYFAQIFISCYMKKRKPHKNFFREILKKSKEKLPAIFVDDAKRNLIVAKEIGFITVWVDNTKNNRLNDRRNRSKYKPDYTITNLKELIQIVKKN